MTRHTTHAPPFVDVLKSDVPASIVVFLVALPLCMGIAIASGAPPISGILSGVIGGVVVGALGGCRMQVSGPANGLIVLVALVIQDHGLEVLGLVVVAAGAIQLAAGLLRTGQIFRAIPPSIIHGLMTGFAVIIFSGQCLVMLDVTPNGGTLENLQTLPGAVWSAVINADGGRPAAAIGALTIILLLVWPRFGPKRLKALPASLIAVLAATVLAAGLSLSVNRVTLPDNLLRAVRLINVQQLPSMLDWSMLELAAVMAFLASTETLLSASAVDRLHQGTRTNYDRELTAQGVGNMLCGALGAIPLTGVIIRSAANVSAGARTRLSSMLHGVWLLVFVALLPNLLRTVPTACLAAILVIAAVKLVNVAALRELWQSDRGELLIYAATAGAIIFFGVLTGVITGIVLALAKLMYRMNQLDIHLDVDHEKQYAVLGLTGTATFMSFPRLAAALDCVPPSAELHVRFDQLQLIDHACMNLLLTRERKCERSGGSVIIDWERLTARIDRTPTSELSDAQSQSPAPEPDDVPPPNRQRDKELARAYASTSNTRTDDMDGGFFRSGWSQAIAVSATDD